MLKYTTIQHEWRKANGLTNNEYVLCDMIYHLSNNARSWNGGWCSMSREVMAKEVGITKAALLALVAKMELNNFVLKHPTTRHLKTTAKWQSVYLDFDKIPIVATQKLAVLVKKKTDGIETIPSQNGIETIPQTVKKLYQNGIETIPYNNINNNNDNNIIHSFSESEIFEKENDTISVSTDDFQKEKSCGKKEKDEPQRIQQPPPPSQVYFQVAYPDESTFKSAMIEYSEVGRTEAAQNLKVIVKETPNLDWANYYNFGTNQQSAKVNWCQWFATLIFKQRHRLPTIKPLQTTFTPPPPYGKPKPTKGKGYSDPATYTDPF